MAIRIRRGTNADRITVVLESGEVAYTTDTKMFYIGDGTTLGGTLIGPSAAGAVAWGAITGTLASQTDLNTALGTKVTGNTAITGATKTKITYDSKGLVTVGADATTADIAASTNKNYVTDAQQTVITNTSGTNTGDQTLANTSDSTSHTATLSATGGSIKLVEGSGITLTTTGTTADGIITIASTGGGGSGTVTSVAALTLGTSGTDLSSSVANGTTTPVITLNVPDASATARGVISTSPQTIAGDKTFTGTTSGITKSMVGLSNVDNTSDVNKPVSTATQTALNLKQDTLVSGTNIKTINSNSILGSGNISISSAVAWGGITGTLSTQTDLQTALDNKVDENTAIVGATKTKITYDAKGLVTVGADATTADIADSTNKRYVTDANLTVIGNTSGTNSGDNAVNSLYSGLAASKQDTLTLTTNFTSGAATLTGATLNIPQYSGGGGSTSWGAITGTLSSQTDLQTALDAKVDENAAITGATKTKITYDAKGLVTSGADATTADIADSLDKRYVTDAQLVVIGNTSGTNTGDQTNITGNAATVTTNANLTGVVTSIGNTTSIANSAITNAMLFNSSVANLSGTNTGDNATNSQYSGLATSKQDTLVSGTNIKTINSTTLLGSGDITTGTVTSVGVSMPSAFSVASSPITTSGTIAITGAGVVSQYVRGDGSLANFPLSSGGGSSISYYLNGSVAQGTLGGVAFKEINKTPVIGVGTNFTISADGYIQSFITDANDPNQLLIPGGNWNFETYFNASSAGGSPSFYVELYKYDGTSLTLIASNSATPEYITGGTNIDLYITALAVPQTVLTLTDRLAVRFYVTNSSRTITMHTENSHLSQMITSFTTGLTALNGLTEQIQSLATGTTGTDFNISSATATHTFNLPDASASNRGALTSANWSTFNAKAEYAPRVQSVTSSATVTPTSTNDLVKITAQAAGLTIANPTGTMSEGQAMIIRIKDNGTAQTIAFDTNYRAIGVTLPTTTTISKTIYIGLVWNDTDTKFDVLGINIQA